ncbi:hypothetical protein GUI26_35625 [Escherichia coli]|nr:hypothetical protein [Escherichia coli]
MVISLINRTGPKGPVFFAIISEKCPEGARGDCQDKVDELYELQEEWTAKAMLNIANMGYFSSDRTIKEYADHIWHIDPVRL